MGLGEVRFQVDGALKMPRGLVATAGADKIAKLWDAKDGAPRGSLEGHAEALTAVAFSPDGKWLAYAKAAPTREAADRFLNERLAAPFTADANDYLYQWEASADYDPSPGLGKIKARVLAINAADDERNPPETGLMEREIKRLKNGRLYLIPASEHTRGHGTTGMAKFWKQQLQELLQTVPRRAM